MVDRKNMHWVLTWFKPVKPYSSLFKIGGITDIRFAVWQIELTKEHKKHAQCYLQFNETHDKAWLLRAFSRGKPHVEIMKGNANDNIRYCSKLDTRYKSYGPYTIGTSCTPRQRNDLLTIQNKIKTGATDNDIADEFFPSWTRNFRAFREYRSMISPKRDWITRVIVLTGRTGCGKSMYVHTHTKDPFRQTNKDWWCGYEGQEDVIIDDFCGSRFTYTYFLVLLDRFDMRVNTKHGSVNFCPRTIWLTSNIEPCDWYGSCPFDAIDRRITYHKKIEDYEEREDWTADVDDAIAFLNTQ